MKILILEDEKHLLDLLIRQMSSYGELYATDNGMDAVRAFNEALTEQMPFGLALLDIMLPGMSGFEVLQRIRTIEAEWRKDGHEGIKIIMVTALDSPKNIMQAFRDNCEGYLTKPYTADELYTLLKKLNFHPISTVHSE